MLFALLIKVNITTKNKKGLIYYQTKHKHHFCRHKEKYEV